jgi:hypothetical protein
MIARPRSMQSRSSSPYTFTSPSTSLRSNMTTPEPNDQGYAQDILDRYLNYYYQRMRLEQHGIDPDSAIPPPIFPEPLRPAREIIARHSPQYADQWALGFEPSDWPRIWNGQAIEIDRFLRYGRNLITGVETPWVHETDYRGVSFRLTIDHQRIHENMPVFVQGMILSCRDWNTHTHKYIIDHCIYKDDLNAYLKVVCYDESQNEYDSRFTRPPLIFAIPLVHCHVREHPNMFKPSTPIPKSHNNLTSIRQLFSKFWISN